MSPPKKEFAINNDVICLHVEQLYEGKIVDIKEEHGEKVYIIHYRGWNSRHDERVKESEAPNRIFEHTEELLAKAKEQAKLTGGKYKKRVDDKLHRKSISRDQTPDSLQSDDKSITMPLKTGGKTGLHPPPDDRNKNNTKPLTLPPALKQILIDEYDLVNRQFRLSKLPSKFSVDKIIEEYKAHYEKKLRDSHGDDWESHTTDEFVVDGLPSKAISTVDQLLQTAQGIRTYFNVILGFQLLYKFERNQYAHELEKLRAPAEPTNKRKKGQTDTKEHEEVPDRDVLVASSLYGLPHLIRLMSRFHEYLQHSGWTSLAINTITIGCHDLMTFCAKNRQRFYDANDYEVSTPEYQKSTFTQ